MPKPPKNNLDLKQSYRLNNPLCELWDVLEGERWDKARKVWDQFHKRKMYRDDSSVEVHHIWGGPHRWDIEPNLISLSYPAHYEFCHKYPDHGRIACLWVKADKGELNQESRELWRECMGFDPIGILHSFEVTEEWVENMRLDLYERFSSYD